MSRYWLFKSEPSVYSIESLRKDGVTYWDGVRNYQARNMLRDDVRKGDSVLFYHSNAEPTGVAGVALVSGEAYPDPSAFDAKDPHFDPRSRPDAPVWFVVDVTYRSTFKHVVTREALAEDPATRTMLVLKKGSRLSIQPVTESEFKGVLRLAK